MMNKISIITFVGMIITGLISVAVFLAPVSGFPYVSVFCGLRSTAWDCERTACKRT